MSIFERINNAIKRKGLQEPLSFHQRPNPWPGLSPYEEPKNNFTLHKFCGRTKETFDLTRMIDDNIFVTLYGKSGNGKTSLLNAGVFPQLRKMHYVPITIRLGRTKENFQRYIINEIEKTFPDSLKEEIWDVVPLLKISDADRVDYLWNYFACHRFFSELDGTIVFPVIVLDQFEEVYKNRKKDADILLKQIHYLMDGTHVLEDTQDRYGNPYKYFFNFRFVISIREDDLFHLEDSIDYNLLSAMKNTRYRLLHISPEGARDAILIPAQSQNLFLEEEKDKIAATIIKEARGMKDEEIFDEEKPIGVNVLSLLCSGIFTEYCSEGGEHITLELVKKFLEGNPLEKFYLEATENLTNKQRKFLEDNLVDEYERRNAISSEVFNDVIKNKKSQYELLKGNHKILQESNNKIELIHDSFCKILLNQKNKRKSRWQLLFEHIAVLIMCVVVCYMEHVRATTFGWSTDSSSIVDNFLVTTVNWGSIFGMCILMFVVVGLFRKSYPIWMTYFGAFVIVYPMLLEWHFHTFFTSYPVSFKILSWALLSFLVLSQWYVSKYKTDVSISEQTYSSLLDNYTLSLGLLVYCCFFVYDVAGFSAGIENCCIFFVLIPVFFLTVFRYPEPSIMCFWLFPISLIVCCTSDVELFKLICPSQQILSYIAIFFGVPLFLIILLIIDFIKDEDREGAVYVTIHYVIAVVAIVVLYVVFYRYKLLLLALYCVAFSLWHYFRFIDDKRNVFLFVISPLIIICSTYVLLSGYNPCIKGFVLNNQEGSWGWRQVVSNVDKGVRLVDARTGKDVVGFTFDGQDEYNNFVIKTKKCHVQTDMVTPLFVFNKENDTAFYFFLPDFEYVLSKRLNKNFPDALIIQNDRTCIMKMLKGDFGAQPANKYKKTKYNLLYNEELDVLNLLETKDPLLIKKLLSEMLCKWLATSWLINAESYNIESADDSFLNFTYAFSVFSEAHYYEEMNNSPNVDWDGTFDKYVITNINFLNRIVNKDKYSFSLQDNFVEEITPILIDYYYYSDDLGMKNILYGKIIRLQQLALIYGLEKEEWTHLIIEPPVKLN